MSTKANWIGATDYNSKISKMQDKGRVNVRKREVNCWRTITKSTTINKKRKERKYRN